MNFYSGGTIIMKNKTNLTWILAASLIALDQVIKLFINHYLLGKVYPLIPPVIYLDPLFNTSYSWYNSMLGWGVGKWTHVAIVGLLMVIIYFFFHFRNERYGVKTIINVGFAFIFAGATCSLIDKIFWNGSLDYIRVTGFFTFDLKDVFINVFCGFLIISLFKKNWSVIPEEEHDVFKKFVKYMLGKHDQ
jgi:signal peptidase II